MHADEHGQAPLTAPRFIRPTIAVLWIASAAVTAFWTVWFFVDRDLLATLHTPAYFAFENAFPAADAWLGFTWVAAAITVQRRRPIAVLWLIASGSSSIFLGLIDVLFDLENAVYTSPDVAGVAIELAINACSFAIGVWSIWFGWRHRRWFENL